MRPVLVGVVVAACGAAAPEPEVRGAPPEARPVAVVAARTVSEAFPPPAGAVLLPGDAFATWLGELAVAPEDVPVRTHDGRVVGHRARVVRLPLSEGDLQQCADSLIRLRATWLLAQGREVVFHATSGDPLPWSRVRDGARPYESGGRIGWRAGGGTWEQYLAWVFTWAGTSSLAAYDTRPVDAPVPGAMLVDPGFPGHAVQLLGVARSADRAWVLVGEGYMPAQDFHVELGPAGGWWPWDGGVTLPAWTFGEEHLRRWR